jgi:hypothetical protein
MAPKRLYIAGPMRGYDLFNFPAFTEAAVNLRFWGYEVLSPAERDLEEGFDPTLNSLDGFDVEAALAADFAMILDCDGIVLLPGWEKSRGARAERFVAEMTGRSVWEYVAGVGIHPAGGWDGNPHVPTTSPSETRITDPNTGGQKGSKLCQLGAVDPLALQRVGEVAGFGADKYERFNFLRGYAWGLSYDALQRHLMQFWGGQDNDEESGLPHLAHAAWHCLALLAFVERGRGTDDRPA